MRGFLMLLLLGGIVVLGIAFYRGWIVVDTEKASETADGSTRVHVTIDPAKARADVRDVLGGDTLEGKVTDVNVGEKQLLLNSGDKTHIVRVTPKTSIERGGRRVTLDAIKTGDHAVVRFQEEKGVRVAISITVAGS